MNRHLLPLLALGLTVCGCTTSLQHSYPSTLVKALSPMELIASIDAHRGQKVTVSGYFTWGTDTRVLWESEAARRDAEQLRKGSWDKCVTIYPSTANAKRFNGMHVHITGKATVIDKNDIRAFWTCNPVAIEGAIVTLS